MHFTVILNYTPQTTLLQEIHSVKRIASLIIHVEIGMLGNRNDGILLFHVYHIISVPRNIWLFLFFSWATFECILKIFVGHIIYTKDT